MNEQDRDSGAPSHLLGETAWHENGSVSPEVSFEYANGTGSFPPAKQYSIENHIWIYSAPIILVFGICTNILTMIVMRRPRMRGTSTSVYLTTLAVGDITVLVVGLIPEWLHQLQLVSIWELHPWVCKVEMYLYYTSLDVAIWVLMAFSCDRFVAVSFPLKKRKYCTSVRAAIVCVVIFIIANINAHVFWTRGQAKHAYTEQLGNCNYLDPYVHFELSIRPFAVLTIAFLVPFFVIAISNIVMVLKLISARDMRRRTVRTRNGNDTRRMRKGFTQTTAMCLSACVAFLILVLPNIILLIGKQWWSGNDAYKYTKAVASQLVYIHHSINFILYSVTGKRFRRELSQLCGKKHPMKFVYRFQLPSFTSTATSRSTLSSSRYNANRYSSSPSASPLVTRNNSNVSSNGFKFSYKRSDSNFSSTSSKSRYGFVESPVDSPKQLSTIPEVTNSVSELK